MVKVKFKGYARNDGTRGPCKIKGVLREPGVVYDVDEGLADWIIEKDLGEKLEEEIPELFIETPTPIPTPPKPAAVTCYDKFMGLVGAHTVQIYGDTGTGKSRFVHAVAAEAQVAGKKVLYLDTEGSLSTAHEQQLENYEYIGPDLDSMIQRVRSAKMQRDQFDLLIVDSIGFPVLTSYASLHLERRLQAILSLTNVMADSVRFAGASKHEKLPAPEKMNL